MLLQKDGKTELAKMWQQPVTTASFDDARRSKQRIDQYNRAANWPPKAQVQSFSRAFELSLGNQFEDIEQPTPPLGQHFALREK